MRSAAEASVSWSEDGGGRPRASSAHGRSGLVAVIRSRRRLSAAEGLLAWDVRFAYLPAAEAILDGGRRIRQLDDPILEDQKGYVYPPQLVARARAVHAPSGRLAAVLVALGLLALVFATL